MQNEHLLLHVAEQASTLLPVAVSTLIVWNNGTPNDALNVLKKSETIATQDSRSLYSYYTFVKTQGVHHKKRLLPRPTN